jgi:hypothetical protein
MICVPNQQLLLMTAIWHNREGKSHPTKCDILLELAFCNEIDVETTPGVLVVAHRSSATILVGQYGYQSNQSATNDNLPSPMNIATHVQEYAYNYFYYWLLLLVADTTGSRVCARSEQALLVFCGGTSTRLSRNCTATKIQFKSTLLLKGASFTMN